MNNFDEYVRENKINELTESEQKEELLERIKESKKYLNNMYKNLQFAEGDLVDYFTYQIKAEESKYDFLMKKIKREYF